MCRMMCFPCSCCVLVTAAIEKQKMVYLMNRDASSKFTISSPLEAHKGNTIVFDCVGVDNGFDNPIFAFLELDYSEADGDPTGEALETTPKVCTTATLATATLAAGTLAIATSGTFTTSLSTTHPRPWTAYPPSRSHMSLHVLCSECPV